VGGPVVVRPPDTTQVLLPMPAGGDCQARGVAAAAVCAAASRIADQSTPGGTIVGQRSK
jgi:hypothetical protein